MVTAEEVVLSFKKYVASPIEFGYMLDAYIESGQMSNDGFRSPRHFLLTIITRTDTSYSLDFLKSILNTASALRKNGISSSEVQKYNFQELRNSIKVMESEKMDAITFLCYLDKKRESKKRGAVREWKNNRNK